MDVLDAVAPVVPIFLREGILGGVILLCVAAIIGGGILYLRLLAKFNALHEARIADHDKWNAMLAKMITDSVKADAEMANALASVKEILQAVKTAFYSMRDEYIKVLAKLENQGRRR